MTINQVKVHYLNSGLSEKHVLHIIIEHAERLESALKDIRATTMSHVLDGEHGFRRCRNIAFNALKGIKIDE